jgi:hypothetical protein
VIQILRKFWKKKFRKFFSTQDLPTGSQSSLQVVDSSAASIDKLKTAVLLESSEDECQDDDVDEKDQNPGDQAGRGDQGVPDDAENRIYGDEVNVRPEGNKNKSSKNKSSKQNESRNKSWESQKNQKKNKTHNNITHNNISDITHKHITHHQAHRALTLLAHHSVSLAPKWALRNCEELSQEFAGNFIETACISNS